MPKEFNFLPDHRLETLITLFNDLFSVDCNTELVGGAEEPLYQPRSVHKGLNRIIFTRDYFSSALHEIAHWCIAGDARRELVDYGYWYCPDGRDAVQQNEFEAVEVKPQALERIFSMAAGQEFHLSLDNLSGGVCVSKQFIDAVHAQTLSYCKYGLPERAQVFARALFESLGNNTNPFVEESYALEDLCC